MEEEQDNEQHFQISPRDETHKAQVMKLLGRIQKLREKIPIDTLASGHPPTEEQETLERLEKEYQYVVNGLYPSTENDESDIESVYSHSEYEDSASLDESEVHLWKKNLHLAKRNGERGKFFILKNNNKKETYKGCWEQDKKSGKGEYITDKSKYNGYWKNDKKDGFGIQWIKMNGKWKRVYKGNWKNGLKEGVGTYYYEDGSIYDGEWKGGKRQGRGIMYYKDGSKYEGEWTNDKEAGGGVKYEVNGNKFQGSYLDGLRHGPGVYYYISEGQKYVGEWYKGVAKTGEFMSIGEEDERKNPLPKIELENPSKVIAESVAELRKELHI